MADEIEYEVAKVFEAGFVGVCNQNWDHRIKRGDLVSKVQRADNPLLPVQGVACKACTKMLPRAKK